MTALLYPVLISLAVPLALAAQNLGQGLQPADIAVPIALALCLAGCAYLVGRALSNEPDNRAVVATSVVLFFYTPGILGRLLPGYGSADLPPLAFILIAVSGIPAVAAAAAATGVGSRGLSRFLCYLFLILCTYQGAQLAWSWAGHPDPPLKQVATSSPSDPEDPDIWLIVLDAYTSPEVLRESYDLDASEFLSELRNRGFQLPAHARTNYVSTVLSLAALLNRRYLDSSVDGFSADTKDLRPAAVLLEDNQTVRDLRERGYEFIFFRSAFPPLSRNRIADLQVPDRVTGEFTRYWTRQTLLASAIKVYCRGTRCLDRLFIAQAEGVVEVDRKIGLMAQVARQRVDRPRFVFTHFLLPHGPMRLTASCEPREAIWPTTAEEAADGQLRPLYSDQVICTNQKILAMVDSLLLASSVPPVILLQGDHGYGRFSRGRPPALSAASEEQIKDRISVFSAYYLPDIGSSVPLFWEGITSVNVMRVVMAVLYDENLSALPDLSFWSDWSQPFAFEEVSTSGQPAPPSVGKSVSP